MCTARPWGESSASALEREWLVPRSQWTGTASGAECWGPELVALMDEMWARVKAGVKACQSAAMLVEVWEAVWGASWVGASVDSSGSKWAGNLATRWEEEWGNTMEAEWGHDSERRKLWGRR